MKNNFFDLYAKIIDWFKKHHVIDFLMTFLILSVFLMTFIIKEHNHSKLYNVSFKILGVSGIAYITRLLFVFFFQRIKSDYALVKGGFLHKVINISLLIPFVLTYVFMICEVKSVIDDKNVKTKSEMLNDSIKIQNDSVNCKLKTKLCHFKTYNNLYEDSLNKKSLQLPLAKKLVFSENLYKKAEDKLLIKDTSQLYKIEAFAKLVDWKIEFDSTANEYYFFRTVDELPENIIDAKNEEPSLFWSVYYHYIDPGNQHIASTEKGRKWAAAIAILGYFFLNGLLVAVLIGWFDRRRDEWLNGEIRYKHRHLPKNKYAVVIGANEVAPSVIKNLLTPRSRKELNFKCERKNKYIILQTNRDAQTVREELAVYLEDKELRKVIIYKALRNSKSEIEKLRLKHATEIYVLGESTLMDGGETYHDAMNMKCVNIIADVLCSKRRLNVFNNKSKKKLCKVMFEYQTTYSIFQFSDVSQKIKDNLVFVPFNRYESWARKVMVESFSRDNAGNIIEYIPLDGSGIDSKSSEHVHFVVVGMSKMGVAMGLQAMLQAHYLNYAAAENIKDPKAREVRKDKTRTRITFIDTNADKEKDFFMGRYESLFKLVRHRYFDASNLKECKWIDPMKDEKCKWKHISRDGQNFLDIEIEFVKGELESEGVRRYLRNISDVNNDFAKESKLTIAICLTQTHQAIAASLYMPVEVYGKVQEIWVYQREASDIINNLNETKTNDKRYKKLRPFGMLYGEYMSDRSQYLRALLVNGAYNIGVNGGKDSEIDMGNKKTYKHIRETWGGLSLDKKFSNRYFADSIYLKVRSMLKEDVNLKERNVVKENAKENESVVVYRSVFELLKSDAVFLENLKTLMNNDNLAISEHNRWDIQQLLFGYSPCDEKVDKEFESLNEKLEKWRMNYVKELGKNKWDDLDESEKNSAEKNPTYKELKGNYNKEKDRVKQNLERLHPNICEFEHLDKIDSGAKVYDLYLNNAIPRILELVDAYNTKLQ